jgi:para-nitrobenzyl esterase
MWLSVVVALLLAPFAARGQTVVTTSGTVQGVTSGAITKYLGIPYAEPPVGALRWQRPVAKSPVAGTIDGTVFKAACSQPLNTTFALDCRDDTSQTASGTLVGSEDCLTLSVWRPTASAATPRPVMVWIHGGAFVNGCAKDGLTEATDLALQGTATGGDGQIVIAIQYRLGPMGFFALPELRPEDANGSVGNYGMLDMVLALQWVQANAAAFGGDPNNVTIFGESAGGIATCALLASPLTNGLFARAVEESGNCTQALPLEPGANAPVSAFNAQSTAYGRGVALASDPSLGCTDPLTRVACMRGKTTAQIFPPWQATPGSLGFPPASMAIDDHFLSEQPAELLRRGNASGRALLVGANANEMTVFTLTGPSLPTATDYENLIHAQFGDYAANILLPIYPAAAFATPLDAYRRIIEDTFFVCPSFQAAKLVRDSGAPAYAYHFAYPVSSFIGAFHGSELFYVFGNTARLSGVLVTPDAGDTLLSNALQDAWTGYAKNGVPVAAPVWSPLAATPGQPASADNVFVWNLNASNALTNSLQLAGALRDGRCAQVETLAPTLNGDLDGFTNERDNCPFATNSNQADSGAIASTTADGIGDACQCGDTSNDGVVDAQDVALLRSSLAAIAPLSPLAAAKCNVESHSAACDVVDVAVIRRNLALHAPAIQQVCAAANPA